MKNELEKEFEPLQKEVLSKIEKAMELLKEANALVPKAKFDNVHDYRTDPVYYENLCELSRSSEYETNITRTFRSLGWNTSSWYC